MVQKFGALEVVLRSALVFLGRSISMDYTPLHSLYLTQVEFDQNKTIGKLPKANDHQSP